MKRTPFFDGEAVIGFSHLATIDGQEVQILSKADEWAGIDGGGLVYRGGVGPVVIVDPD